MMWQGIRGRLTYANVASTAAVFIALGGTSYAVATLPRNSVGAKQVRRGAIGGAELRKGAVHSIDIRNGAVRLKDLRSSTRSALMGRTGPAGPPGASGINYFLLANAAGGRASGNGVVIGQDGSNGFVVSFPSTVANCALVASPARVAGGAVEDPPPGSTATVAHSGINAVVKTFDPGNEPKALPFALIVAC